MEINAYTLILFGLILLIMFYFLLVLGNAYTTRRLRKKYKEEEDKSKNGEKIRNQGRRITNFPDFRGREFNPTVTSGEPVVEGFNQSEGRELLSATDVNADGNAEPELKGDSTTDKEINRGNGNSKQRFLSKFRKK